MPCEGKHTVQYSMIFIEALRSGCSKVHEEGQMFVVDLPGGRFVHKIMVKNVSLF